MKLLKDINVVNKRVFLRADLDVPLGGLDQIHHKLESETATRLTNLKGTVDYLLREGAKQIVIAGHIDRPDGPDPAKSTKHLLEVLENILKQKIVFKADLDGSVDGELVLLENLRFWPGETENDDEFADKLAEFGEVYVNEAFGNSHREHASMIKLAELLPHAAGQHLEEEVRVLTNVLEIPARPFLSVVGGAKIETKVPVITNLAKISHHVLVGGELPKEIEKTGQKFPENVIVAKLTDDKFDIDLESAHRFSRYISNARTIVWNGPMGFFEEGHETGSRTIANAIIESKAYSVVGGGETTQFLEKHGLLGRFSFVSAGGGAMLEFLSGKTLPGISSLE